MTQAQSLPKQWQTLYQQHEYQVQNFIDGEYQDTLDNSTAADVFIEKYSPRDGELLYRFHQGCQSDVDHAVTVARDSFQRGDWSLMPLAEKRTVLYRLADLIDQHASTFALYESLDVGKPVSKALSEDVSIASTGYLRTYIDMAEHLTSASATDSGHFAYLQRKPLGVVAGICGWNYPLVLAVSKLAPALLMGNSLILKPSEFTSLSTSFLAQLAVEAGVPKGVFNVVNGAGHTVGAALSHHQDINLLSFVGGSVTGKAIVKAAGESNMKRLILECGGKSPYLVFDDSPDDLDALADDIVARAFPNQGALCVAGTRLLLQAGIREKLMPLIIKKSAAITPQDPLSETCQFGALVNKAHMEKVLNYIKVGKQEGGELLIGGERYIPEQRDLQQGYYIPPTIIDHVKPKDTIAQEEIFGPVLSVLTFTDEAEAIAMANDSEFGLAAYVATENLARAQRLSQQLNTGNLTIRATNAPRGGYVVMASDKIGQSGFGMSQGLEGLAAYSVTTTVRVLS